MTVRPTAGQLSWQELAFGMFCHFGINTYYGKDWSDGRLDPAGFAPQRLDPRQWVRTAQEAGMRYLILTAKHHDGFCLWPTDTTSYSVRAAPGQPDVVGAVAAACREAGMPFGLYLSPWDRNAPSYADPPAYDRFYVAQLTELCTRYGPLVELWFDGAGPEERSYDTEAIMDVVARHQPEAMVFGMGRPTIRWIGNEDGVAADPCYYAVDPATGKALRPSRAASAPAAAYRPPECDVAIRRHWFWQPDDLETLKTREHLLGIYYRSVGVGANLLLNLPPDRAGQLDPHDRARLLEMADELRRRFATPLRGQISQQGAEVGVDFGAEVEIDHLVLREDLRDGQLIDGYIVMDERDRTIAAGQTVGQTKIDVFRTVRTRRVHVTLSTPDARLREVIGYRTGHEQAPALGPGVDYEAWGLKADRP